MPEVLLTGCSPEPLAGYLKALGVFRLVAEHHPDADVCARWVGETFALESHLDLDGLRDFFLTAYRPTPVLAPWNAGSGFYASADALSRVEAASSPRLAPYQEVIGDVRRFAPAVKPKDDDKERLLLRCRDELGRDELDDQVGHWLDTCFVLREDGAGYFPLLGTGGNDGRLDFTNNFMQRLAEVMPFGEGDPLPKASCGWLEASLFGEGFAELSKVAIGQFDPGGAGGANAGQGFGADSLVNPWDFVLMIEGAMLFAGSVARRLGSRGGHHASFPFTVQSLAVGYGSATAGEETSDGSRAELWLPLWDASASLPEIRRLFSEGRAQFGRRQARNAVEFSLAACLLGVERGIGSFARYGFLKRNGLAYLAAPLGRVRVTERRLADLLDDAELNGWLDRLRRACGDKGKTPARYQSALRDVDRAVFDFATRAQTDEQADRKALRDVLAALGRAERTLAKGLRFCDDKNIRPLQKLKPDWLRLAEPDDEWREFRLAAALASVLGDKHVGPLRVHLEEVEGERHCKWSEGSASAVWSKRPLTENLCDVFLRRWMECERAGGEGVSLSSRVFAPLADVVAFLNGETNDDLLEDLLWALIGIDWTERDWFGKQENITALRKDFRSTAALLPADFALLRLLVRPVGLTLVTKQVGKTVVRQWQAVRGEAQLVTSPDAAPFQLLGRSHPKAPGVLDDALGRAAQRLWSDRLVPFGWQNRRRRGKPRTAAEADGRRLVAACLFPLSRGALSRLAGRALVVPELDP